MKSKLFVLAAFLLLSPAVAMAQSNTLPDPLHGLGGNATVIDIVYKVFAGFAAFFSLFAFGFLLFSAFKLMVSRGNEEAITKGKQGVTWSVLGFVVAILSYSLITATAAFFNTNLRDELLTPDQLVPSFNSCGGDYSFVCIFNRVITGVLGLAFVASALMLVYGGYRLITSGGNEEGVTSGKRIITWAVAGFAVIILSYSIILAVNALFT